MMTYARTSKRFEYDFEYDEESCAGTAQRLIRLRLVAVSVLAGMLAVPATSQESPADFPVRPPMPETRDGSHDAIPRLAPAAVWAGMLPAGHLAGVSWERFYPTARARNGGRKP